MRLSFFCLTALFFLPSSPRDGRPRLCNGANARAKHSGGQPSTTGGWECCVGFWRARRYPLAYRYLNDSWRDRLADGGKFRGQATR